MGYLKIHCGGDEALSNEELVVLIQNGERDWLMELWHRVNTLVRKEARRWGAASLSNGNGAAREDFIQAGFVALLRAVNSFNGIERGYKFITHFKLKLTTVFAETAGLRTKQLKHDPLRDALRLEAPRDDGDPDIPTVGDFIADPQASQAFEDVETKQLYTRLYEALERLTADEQRVIQLRYWRLLTVEQSGQCLGIYRAAASKIERSAMRKLRNPAVSQELRQLWRCG